MAGYSGTPLVKKLGIKEGHAVATQQAPGGFPALLGQLPDRARLTTSLSGKVPLDVLVAFFTSRSAFVKALPKLRARMAEAAGLWIAWPKKSSGVATDMTEDVVRAVALPTGLVDNKVCAIDETWLGLRLVIRVELRR